MLKIPPLEVITKDAPQNAIGLDRLIEERRLLKIKVKLMQIELFDNDLKRLNEESLGIDSLRLEDFKLTESCSLVVPVYSRIVKKEDNANILESYLIYLSYLYNIDLVTIFKNNYNLFYEIILSIDLPPIIKMHLFELIKYNKGEFFSNSIELLNNVEYREIINKNERRLRRINVN